MGFQRVVGSASWENVLCSETLCNSFLIHPKNVFVPIDIKFMMISNLKKSSGLRSLTL